MTSRRYIEITSTNRNRKQWPCPSEFIVPVDCRNRGETPLEAQDPIALGYPEKGWYAVPQTTPNAGDIPRNINGLYYGSLWPLSPNLTSILSPNFTQISAMHFSGGNYNAPHLNSVVTQPGNVWSATSGMVSYNPYYTPKKNYFSGALLIRFAPVPANTAPVPPGWTNLAGIGSPDPSVLLNLVNVQKLTVNTGFATLIKIGDRVIQVGGIQGVVVCVEDPTTFYVGIIVGPFVITTPITSNEATPTAVFPTSVSTVESGARYCGQVETSIIKSYDPLSGAVELLQPLSEDFSFQDDYYLIDFFSDPENGFSSYFNEGARIFIPNGSTAPQAYEGMIIENYTLSRSSSKVISSIVKSYDYIRRVAFLETILPLSTFESPDRTTAPISIIKSHGSDSFFLRHKPELAIKTYERISVTEGSVLVIDIRDGGSKYRIGETIASPSDTTVYYSTPTTVFSYPAANYVFRTGAGRGFRGEITSVSITGGILSIKVIQQGQGYQRGNSMSLVANTGSASGTDCLLTLPNVYQAIEVYRKNTSDGINNFGDGNFVFLPTFGQIKTSGLTNTDKQVGAPQLPRYQYLPPTGHPPTSLQNTNILDIRQSGYPVRLNGCVATNNFNIPETGVRQIVSTINKDITFGDWMTAAWPDTGFGDSTTVVFPTSVIYLAKSYDFTHAGLTDNGIPVVVNNTSPLTSSSYLQQQILEILEYSSDNLHPLNFTGTRQNQMVCYEIKLISITMPNVPLDNEIGGLVAFYPYFYIELSNVNSPMRGNKGVLYSNNPHANRALFRVDIRDTNTPLRSKFIKLRGGGTQTVKFRPNDDLYFRVFLNDGKLFETVTKDTSPPLPPDFFVQISAQFQIQRMV